MSVDKREFAIANEYQYDRSGPLRWFVAHVLRYPWIPLAGVALALATSSLYSSLSVTVGRAFDAALRPDATVSLIIRSALPVLAIGVGLGLAQLGRNLAMELLAHRVERDARDELYLSLLGKSITFHSRQRIGDVMARATNDVFELNLMISPALSLILSSALSLTVPVLAIALNLPRQLMFMPILFWFLYAITVRRYSRQIEPIVDAERERFGTMNARLAETIAGIEVVKGSAQERQEREVFARNAARLRDAVVQQGEARSRYLTLLAFSLVLGGGLLHALLLFQRGAVTVGQVIMYMGLLRQLEFPSFMSVWTFAVVQTGLAAARRILELINAESELDENPGGCSQTMRGEIAFHDVCFAYNGTPVLQDIRFHANPGDTIAIVGETGSGKSTLAKLVNRTFDVTSGQVLVDGVDVREWNLASLRSQISTIEQDIFLYSRSLEENIAFGLDGKPDPLHIMRAAREAQAHEFIVDFPQGYQTEIGERGVTLSGGQRQRVAIARAFLTDPRILILDDSTSAIDSATEDQIQRAMRRIMMGRTTLLITHRLSQIRWADRILVLRQGRLVDQGTHDELMQRCEAYRRIFARYH